MTLQRPTGLSGQRGWLSRPGTAIRLPPSLHLHRPMSPGAGHLAPGRRAGAAQQTAPRRGVARTGLLQSLQYANISESAMP